MAVMSKTLATICVDADIEYDIEEAKLGNIFTEEAYPLFQRLQFKNLLGRFDVTGPANEVEDHFRIISGEPRRKPSLKGPEGGESGRRHL